MGGVFAQVGIGTTSPSNDLDVEGSGAAATAIDINNTSTGDPKINFQLSGSTTFSMGVDDDDSDKFKIGTSALETSTRFTIDASGNCGIGTTSPATKLNLGCTYTSDNEITSMIAMEITNSGYWDWAIGPTVRSGRGVFDVKGGADGLGSISTFFTIDGEFGYVGIGASTPGYKLTVNGQPGANGYTAFTNYSDSRLKTNISSLDTGALSKIMQLRPVSFQYNKKYLQLYAGSDLQKVHKGFIAQEIRKVFPEMVSEMKASPDSVQYLDLNVSHLQVYLVKALQEQQVIINAQKAEIDALKVNALKVAELENKMNAMLLLLNTKTEVTAKQ